tara:strand:- start:865 stop:1536 length:672 start_codon:yes stop_codon:yes gene_type:complete
MDDHISDLEREAWRRTRGTTTLSLGEAKLRVAELETEAKVKQLLRERSPFASTDGDLVEYLTAARALELSAQFTKLESDVRVQLLPAAAFALGDRCQRSVKRRRAAAGGDGAAAAERAAALQALVAAAAQDTDGWVRSTAALVTTLDSSAALASSELQSELQRIDGLASAIEASVARAVREERSAGGSGISDHGDFSPLENTIMGAAKGAEQPPGAAKRRRAT